MKGESKVMVKEIAKIAIGSAIGALIAGPLALLVAKAFGAFNPSR